MGGQEGHWLQPLSSVVRRGAPLELLLSLTAHRRQRKAEMQGAGEPGGEGGEHAAVQGWAEGSRHHQCFACTISVLFTAPPLATLVTSSQEQENCMVTCPEPPRWLGAGIQSQLIAGYTVILDTRDLSYSALQPRLLQATVPSCPSHPGACQDQELVLTQVGMGGWVDGVSRGRLGELQRK